MGLVDLVKKAAFVDILRGMSVTGTYFVVDKVTVEYPKEKLETYPRFRGIHALIEDQATGDAKCVACMLCPTICPSQCIHVEGEELPDGRSHAKSFDLDLARCIFCGLCEEVCPVAAIVMTRFYEGSTYDKRDFLLDKDALVANQKYAHKEVFVQPAGAAAPKPPVTADPFKGLAPSRAAAMAAEPAPAGQSAAAAGAAAAKEEGR
jgi:NADH-quinone oxidoreductase subunit I